MAGVGAPSHASDFVRFTYRFELVKSMVCPFFRQEMTYNQINPMNLR